MPHSSGGGSHGGGSHGGGGHHSGGGSSSSSYSHSYYAGCSHRYVYYKNKTPVYIYSDKSVDELKKPVPVPVKIIVILWFLPFFLAGFQSLFSAFHKPRPLKMDYDNIIYVDDKAGVIDDEDILVNHLERFQEKTGITPAVITVNNEEWENYYTNLENYSYNLYVNTFDDEKHWLVVYSEPENPDANFNNWYFEGMQGDDTDPIVTNKAGREFTEDLHKYLLQEQKMSVEEAIEQAFDNQTETIMNFSFNTFSFLSGLLILGFVGYMAYYILTDQAFKKFKDMKEVVMAKTKEEILKNEATCEYCGGVYVVDSSYNCPHCGALTKRD